MKKRYLFLLLLLCSLEVSAQTEQEKKKRIVDIKLDYNYLWSEATDKTEEAAVWNAESGLLTQVKSWLVTNGKSESQSQSASAKWNSITTNRGNQKRAFFYIKTSDIAPVETTSTHVAKTKSSDVLSTPVETNASVAIPNAIAEIAACKKYADMAEKVESLQAAGQIKSYARYASLNHPEACYLIIYNREGEVVDILTPGATRRNIATGEETSLSLYKGCGAIGVEVSN